MAGVERWIELTEKFDYRIPGSRAVISFKAGKRYFMNTAQAEQAVSEGKGKPSPKVTEESE